MKTYRRSANIGIFEILIGVVLLSIAVAFFIAWTEASEWDEYRDSNGCEQTGRQRFRNTSQYTGNKFITTTIAVDEWKCANGETRWRDAE
jgi:hypothetical protein